MSEKKLGFGLMRLPSLDPNDPGKIDIEQVKKMVDTFIERGFTYFDTAWMYCAFKSENAVKEALVSRHPRDSFTLTTKLHSSFVNSFEDRDRIFNEQMEKTGVTYFDYYLIHDINSHSIETYNKFDCFGWIRDKKEKGLVKGHGNFPVYIDSPLAIEATRIFKDTDPDCFDADTRALLEKGIDPITFPGLRVTVTSDESRMINADRVPKVILSASGMCEAGRIRHHLKHNLWRPECTILFVGYQAVGTLGRTLLEGATTVKLFGEPIEVQAELCQLTGMSGHADREGLLRWVNSFEQKPKRVFVMHGEDETEDHFVQTLTEQGFTACAPYNGAQWAIGAEGAVCLQEGMRVRIEHKANEGQSRAASVFQRLVSAGKRLLRVIEHNEGGANKDLAKFADQINALCDKWDR